MGRYGGDDLLELLEVDTLVEVNVVELDLVGVRARVRVRVRVRVGVGLRVRLGGQVAGDVVRARLRVSLGCG